MAAKPKPYPKSMGACADLLFLKRQARLELDRQAAAAKAEEVALENHIIDNLPKGDGGAVGRTHKVIVKTEDKLVVSDWPVFYAYLAKNKTFEMLQKRISTTAIQERLDDGKKVPGIGTFTAVKVSLTKI